MHGTARHCTALRGTARHCTALRGTARRVLHADMCIRQQCAARSTAAPWRQTIGS
jgi:hypothetical protein